MAKSSSASSPRLSSSTAGDEAWVGRLTRASFLQDRLEESRRAGSLRLMCLLLPLAARLVLRLGAVCRPFAMCPLAMCSLAMCPYGGLDRYLTRSDALSAVRRRRARLLQLCVAWFGLLGDASGLRFSGRDSCGGRRPPLLLGLLGAAGSNPSRQLLHVRLPLFHLSQERRCNEDRRVCARHHSDEERKRQILQGTLT